MCHLDNNYQDLPAVFDWNSRVRMTLFNYTPFYNNVLVTSNLIQCLSDSWLRLVINKLMSRTGEASLPMKER